MIASKYGGVAISPGDSIDGRYQVLKQLGQGGFGTVFSALDLNTGQQVAVKLAQGPESGMWMLDEARHLQSVYPDMVLGAGAHEQVPYIVMKQLHGRSVDRGRVSDVVEVLKGVLPELARVHAQGLVHRDIKPNNIFQETDGKYRLIDFGIMQEPDTEDHKARRQQLQAEYDRVRRAQDDLVKTAGAMGPDMNRLRRELRLNSPRPVGDQRYAPPEQLEGDGLVQPSADVFSLGATVYQMLSGELVHKTCPDPILPVSDAASHTPSGLAAVIDKSLSCNPANRYQNATEMLQALNQSLQDRVTLES